VQGGQEVVKDGGGVEGGAQDLVEFLGEGGGKVFFEGGQVQAFELFQAFDFEQEGAEFGVLGEFEEGGFGEDAAEEVLGGFEGVSELVALAGAHAGEDAGGVVGGVFAPDGVGQFVAMEASGVGEVVGVTGVGFVVAEGFGGGLEAFGEEGVEEVNGVAGSVEFACPELVVAPGGFEEDAGLRGEDGEEFCDVLVGGLEESLVQDGVLGAAQGGASGA